MSPPPDPVHSFKRNRDVVFPAEVASAVLKRRVRTWVGGWLTYRTEYDTLLRARSMSLILNVVCYLLCGGM